jgi:spore coat protein CotH
MRNARRPTLAALLIAAVTVTGCTATATAGTASAGTSGITSSTSTTGSVFDASRVHTISLDVDAADVRTMLATYVDSGDKKWIKATVTIDGTTFSDAGIKLKGNSSLKGVSTSSKPETLPWRIRLDKYVDGQNLDGYTDFTVRASSRKTAMNEAVALDLLGDAGLATEHAVETRFSVNGSDAVLRLTVQNLDQTWVKQNFPKAGADSILYKSDADGDWSWRGKDGDYTSSFDIEAGPDDYSPLIELLDLLNNGTTEEITEELPELVDLDSLATYLAFEDLIDNFDDIDGPGNNSYLFWDSATQKFTVVAWDHNLAFGATPNGGGQGGGPGGQGGPGGVPGRGNGNGAAGNGGDGAAMGAPPTGALPTGAMPTGAVPTGALPGGNGQANGRPNGQGGAGGRGGPGGMDNPLVDAFNANSTWTAMYTKAQTTLKTALIDSGKLDDSVTAWSTVITAGASDLVPKATITSEANAIRAYDK